MPNRVETDAVVPNNANTANNGEQVLDQLESSATGMCSSVAAVVAAVVVASMW